jgi:ATP-dependent RNA helicase DeaD
LPDDTAVYTHRSGRTGRAGKTGVSVAIIHSRERGRMREIERIIGKKFERKEVPTPQHIIEKQLYNLADRIEKVKVDDNEIDKYLPGISKRLAWLSEQDLLKRVLSLEFNRLLNYYKDAPNIDYVDERASRSERKGERREKGGERAEKGERRQRNDKDKDRRTAEPGMARIYVNAGKNAGFYAGNIIELLNKSIQGKRVDVGRIDLMPGYSLFDVKAADANRVVAALKGNEFFGKRLYSEIASADKDYAKSSERKGEKAPKKSRSKK